MLCMQKICMQDGVCALQVLRKILNVERKIVLDIV
jgi:hypothetical protein